MAQSGQEAERWESWEVPNHVRGISFLQQVLTQCLVDARHWGDSQKDGASPLGARLPARSAPSPVGAPADGRRGGEPWRAEGPDGCLGTRGCDRGGGEVLQVEAPPGAKARRLGELRQGKRRRLARARAPPWGPHVAVLELSSRGWQAACAGAQVASMVWRGAVLPGLEHRPRVSVSGTCGGTWLPGLGVAS